MKRFCAFGLCGLLFSTVAFSSSQAQWIPPSQRSKSKARYSFWGGDGRRSNADWVRQQMYQGLDLAKVGRYRDAQALFTDLLDAQPKNAELWNNLGVTLKKQGKFRDAIDAFKKAISIDKKLAAAYKNLGLAHEKVKNYREAYGALQKYLEVYPEAPDQSQVNARLRLIWNKK